MTVRIPGEGEVLREVSQLLMEHLSPAKVVRFWASWQTSHSQYLAWRDERFDAETVASLYAVSYTHLTLPTNREV